MENEGLFTELGLKLEQGEAIEGNTYPIYGMITKIICEEPGNVQVELNKNIIANINIFDSSKVEVLKSRAFEVGIFVSTIVKNSEKVLVDCHTIIFGKQDLQMS